MAFQGLVSVLAAGENASGVVLANRDKAVSAAAAAAAGVLPPAPAAPGAAGDPPAMGDGYGAAG